MQAFIVPKDFWGNHRKNGDCLEWLGGYIFPKRTPKGYGVIYYGPFRRQIGVHRLAWILEHQQLIPKGMVIRHRCDNTRCYNPDHLVIGTPLDNVDDMINRQREGIRMRVTHCVRGHEYTPENTLIVNLKGRGKQRKCRICKNEESRLYRLKRKNRGIV